jgi:hypothetical protein
MYVLTQTSSTANHRGSGSTRFPFVHARITPTTRTRAARRFDSMVKKLRKFQATVGRCPPHSVVVDSAFWIDRVSCAMTAARARAATARRTYGHSKERRDSVRTRSL